MIDERCERCGLIKATEYCDCGNSTEAVAEIAALKEALNNLLAVIHRDSGHYASEHGLVKASEDAEKIVIELRVLAEGHK